MGTMADRLKQINDAVKRGEIETRERVNATPCPLCSGEHERVYRWLKPTAGYEAMDKQHLGDDVDPRWFCYCGYAEEPRRLPVSGLASAPARDPHDVAYLPPAVE